MAKATGKELLLCNLFIGGCSLEQHWNNWREEKTDYEYEIYLPFETEMTRANEVALHEAVEDEEWDVANTSESIAERFDIAQVHAVFGDTRKEVEKKKLLK